MFFEPLPPEDESTLKQWPAFSIWSAPPSSELGAVVPVERVVARSTEVAVVMSAIRAFHEGCMLEVEVVSRLRGLLDEDWWDWSAQDEGPSNDRRLPDRLLRMGVRYADGTKVTTIEQRRRRMAPSGEPPAGPLLTWWPGGGGPRGGGVFGFDQSWLWLWPLPPAEVVEFAVEWPLANIDLTFMELDGAAITAAAERSTEFWPNQSTGSG